MDRRRALELFPTLLPLVENACAAMARLPRAAARGFWRRRRLILAIILVPIALHLVLTLTTDYMVRQEIRRLRALGFPTCYNDVIARNRGTRTPAAQALLSDLHNGAARAPDRTPNLSGFSAPWSEDEWNHAELVNGRLGQTISLAESANWVQADKCIRNSREAEDLRFNVRQTTKHLLVAAVVEARAGQTEQCARLVGLANGVYMATPSLGLWQPCTHSPVCDSARETITRIAALGPLDEQTCRRFYDALPEVPQRRIDRELTEGQLLQCVRYYRLLRSLGPSVFADFLDEGPSRTEMRAGAYISAPWTNINEIAALRAFRRETPKLSAPYKDYPASIRNGDYGGGIMACLSLVRMGFYVRMSDIARHRDLALAEDRGTRLFIAVLGYKARHGEYPKRIGDLRRLGWAKVELDPFTGKPFSYQRRARGFVLYSIGFDMIDNGGKRMGPGMTQDDTDIAWLDPPAIRQAQIEERDYRRRMFGP